MVKIKQKLALRACCAAHVLHDGLTDMLYALLPLLRDAFGLNYLEVGMIRSAHRAASAIFQIPAGVWSERVGERSLLVIGMALAGVAFLSLGFAEGYWTVLLFIFLAGCGDSFHHPLSSAIISHAYPDAGQRTALGTYNAFGDVGKFLFLGLTILMTAPLGFSWQAPVLGFGAAALLLAVATYLLLSRAAAGGPPELPSKDDSVETVTGWGLKHTRGFFALSVIATLDITTRTGFLIFVAFLMIEKGVPTEWAAAAVLITVFGGLCGKFVVGQIAERIGVTRAIALTEVATAALIGLVVVMPSYAAFFLLPVLGVFLNGTSTAIYGAVPDLVAGEKHSRAYGLIYTLNAVFGLIAPLLFGLIADWTDVTTTLVAVALTVVPTIPLCGMLARDLDEVRAN
ncbi:MAG: MFS transporter [Rhodospirillaceae bacterium]|nr:MFS transporter [Rhodospirillaceae bacterium]